MLTLLLAACSPDPAPFAEVPSAPEASPEAAPSPAAPAMDAWTVFVFLNGDNDLEGWVKHDLNELEAGGPSADVNVVVLADRAEGYSENDGDWTGTRRYAIERDAGREIVSPYEDMGEMDLADPQTLADFLVWGDENYPAERVMVVLWDHGTSWWAQTRGVSWDESSGSEMSIRRGELQEGLAALTDRRGAPIDLLAFDACNMGGWEVADAMSGYADAMVAAPSTVGFEGLQYTPTLALLRNEPEISTNDLAIAMARDAVRLGGEKSFSAIDLTEIGGVTDALDALGSEVAADPVLAARLLAMRADIQGLQPGAPYWYADLGDLATLTSGDPDLGPFGADLADATDAAVLASPGNGALERQHGLSVFFGLKADAIEKYARGKGNTWKDTSWDEALLAMRATR